MQNKALAKLRAVQPGESCGAERIEGGSVMSGDSADMLIEQREEAAKICHKLALAHDNLRPRQEDKAIAFCLEALKVRLLLFDLLVALLFLPIALRNSYYSC